MNFKAFAAAVAASTVVAGCATVTALKTTTPTAIYQTNRDARAVAECIQARWHQERFGLEANGAGLKGSADTFTVASPASGTPSEVAEVKVAGETTIVSVYVQAAMDVGKRRESRISAAHICAAGEGAAHTSLNSIQNPWGGAQWTNS